MKYFSFCLDFDFDSNFMIVFLLDDAHKPIVCIYELKNSEQQWKAIINGFHLRWAHRLVCAVAAAAATDAATAAAAAAEMMAVAAVKAATAT